MVNGIEIPEGLCIQLDAYSVHRDPELWGPIDPESFYPDRFITVIFILLFLTLIIQGYLLT